MLKKSNQSFYEKSIKPIWAVFKKSLYFDIYERWKFIIALIAMSSISIMLLPIDPQTTDNIYSLNAYLGLGQVIFSYCVIFSFIMIHSSASLISEETKSGTMLLLISKPISRGEIVWGKYLALWIYGIVINLVSCAVICLVAIIKFPFNDIFSYFGTQILFSLVILFFYGTFTLGLSMILKNIKTIAMIPLLIIMITIFGAYIIRPALFYIIIDGRPFYEVFQIYHFDLGYHFVNIYAWFYETFVSPLPIEVIRGLRYFGLYTIYYDDDTLEEIITKMNFYSPQASLALVLILASIVIIIGFILYKKRDIN